MLTRSRSKRKFDEENTTNKEKTDNVVESVLTSQDYHQDTFEMIVEAAKADVEREGSAEKKRRQEETATPVTPATEERPLRRNFSKESLDEIYDHVKKRWEEESIQKDESENDDMSKKPAAVENGNGVATGIAAVTQDSVANQQTQVFNQEVSPRELVERSRTASLTNSQPVAKKYDIDLEGLYNFVLNDGEGKELDYRQRMYHKGLMADSMEQVRKTAETFLKNDKDEMKEYVKYSENEAKKEFEAGNIDKALLSIVDSRSMRAMVDYMEEGNSIYRKATNVMAI